MAQRPIFDPSRIQVPPEERLAPSGPAVITPRQVNDLIKGAVSRHVPSTLHVLGQIGDLSHPRSGHLYFTLKDESSELRCVMWRSAARRLAFKVEAGMELIATGGLDVYVPRGTVQLIVRRLEPRGVGALELAFRQLKQRLAKEGLFDPQRKRPLPRIPQRIALVTSPSGAAIRDILHTLRRRFPALEVFVLPVRVQGAGAAAEIARTIELLNRSAERLGGIDVAIVGRGGGSLEDLWPFNEEVVARAIAASEIPIVSAVGHEVDVSISDLVADVRAPTPTAAAEMITPVLSELIEMLAAAAQRVERAARQGLETGRRILDGLLSREWLARPLRPLREREQRIDELQSRLRLAAAECSREARRRLTEAERGLLRFGTGAAFARLARRLDRYAFQMLRALDALLRRSERRTEAAGVRLQRVAPIGRLMRYDERLSNLTRRAPMAALAVIAERRGALRARVDALTACDPKRVLQRGYSITRDARTRQVVRSIKQIRDRMRLITEVADGQFRSTAQDPRQPELFDE